MPGIDTATLAFNKLNAQLGRHGGAELLNTVPVPMTSPVTYQMGNFVTLDRPLLGFVLRLKGQAVIAAAAYDAGVPESFANLVQNVKVQGQHVIHGQATPWDISGASLFALPLMNQKTGNTFLSGTTRQGDPGQPFVTTANAITTPATGTVNFDLFYWMPAGMYDGVSPSAQRTDIDFTWMPNDWKGQLIFNVSMGDKTALGTPNASTTVNWADFGGGSSPQLMLYAVYTQLGSVRDGYVGGSNALMIRNEQGVPTLLTSATSQQTRLADLQASITSRVIVKTGINLTGTTSGVQAFASLSDVQLDQTSLYIGNKVIKNIYSNLAYKNGYLGVWEGIVQPQGYLALDFCESGNPMTALRLDDPKFTQNANPQVKTTVLAANANNRQQYIQEYVLSAAGQLNDKNIPAWGPYSPAGV